MISRRVLLLGLGAAAVTGAGAALTQPAYRWRVAAQAAGVAPSSTPEAGLRAADGWAAKLVAAAETQIGRTTRYDPAYMKIGYPMGDVPPESGVCTDVVIRAYHDAFGVDLQRLVHEDMRAAFSDYPRTWGLTRPDSNIDHRRVPNLERFFIRRGAALPITAAGSDYRPGDLVSQRLPSNLPHIAIVTHRLAEADRPLVVHNIGAGTRLDDSLFEFKITGHFRFAPEAT